MMCPVFRCNRRPAVAHREDDPIGAVTYIQLHPALPFPVHEFVMRGLQQVEQYQADLRLAAVDDTLRINPRNHIVCPKPLGAQFQSFFDDLAHGGRAEFVSAALTGHVAQAAYIREIRSAV